jgi:hypothetical protein
MHKLVPALAIAASLLTPSIGIAAHDRTATDHPAVTPATAPVPVWRDAPEAPGIAAPVSAGNLLEIEHRALNVTPVRSIVPVEIPADRVEVRTVGPAFLPPLEDEIDLRAISAGYNEPVNAVFAGIVGYLRAPGLVTTANAEAAPAEGAAVVAAVD